MMGWHDWPPFTGYIGRIFRGETYGQFEPRPDEKLKIFLAAHAAGFELGIGASDKLFDFETFQDTPYTSPAGWLADFREWMFTYDGLVRLDVKCGDFPMLVLRCYPAPWGFTHTYEQIIFFNSRFWDPKGESSHEWDFEIFNEDSVPVTGAVQVAMVLTEVGSSRPTHKEVKCPACGHLNRVELEETRIKCEKCGAEFYVPFFPGKVI